MLWPPRCILAHPQLPAKSCALSVMAATSQPAATTKPPAAGQACQADAVASALVPCSCRETLPAVKSHNMWMQQLAMIICLPGRGNLLTSSNRAVQPLVSTRALVYAPSISAWMHKNKGGTGRLSREAATAAASAEISWWRVVKGPSEERPP